MDVRLAPANSTALDNKKMTLIATACAALLALHSAPAAAFEIDTGNEDLKLRWDNQIRYNLGIRVEKLNPDFSDSSATDATERSVKRGGLVMNRVDLLSEADLVYKGAVGVRLSAAAWDDFAIRKGPRYSDSVVAAGFPFEYKNNEYNHYAKRYARGPSAEVLDAFVFGRIDAGNVPINVKLGNHVVYWGESLFSLFHGIAYSQAPLNLQKATSSPGIEAKEVFMPIRQLSGQAQLSPELSIAAQVMLDWKPSRLPAGGTYFAGGDAPMADSVSAGPGFAFPFGGNVAPDSKKGQFGLNMRWSPDWLEGTVGAYYRKFNEVMPWGFLRMGSTFVPAVGGPLPQDLHFAYAKNTEMYALSLAKNIGGVNLGADLSYRKNTALISGSTPLDASVFGFQGLEGPRGNTWHLVANTIYLLPKTRFFEGGSLQAEFVYSRLDKVTRNEGLFLGEGTAQCATAGRGLKATDAGCATKDYYGFQVGGAFDYPQVLPGVNMTVPFSVGYGLKGNAAIPGGGNEGASTWSLGLQATYLNVHQFTVKYNDGRTPYIKTAAGAIVQNGSSAIANSHGWLSFTYKVSF